MGTALRVELFLITEDNDYQLAQAASLEEAGRRLGVQTKVSYAHGESLEQGQRVAECIQGEASSRPDAIILHSVGKMALPQVARAAVDAGIAWALLNQA